MNRLNPAALLLPLLLAACAGDGPALSDKRPATPPGGIWEVVEASALEPVGATQSPYMGQRLALYAHAAGDPAGRLCQDPAYLGFEAPAADLLGGGDDKAPRPAMDVSCRGEAFGTYVSMPDGSLRTRVNSWLLTLRRAEPEMAAAPPPPMPAPQPAVNRAPLAKADGKLVYLASYKTEGSAKAGYKRLAGQSRTLAHLPMVTRKVDLGAKGTWIRLYARAGDAAQGKLLCVELGKKLPGCGAAWGK